MHIRQLVKRLCTAGAFCAAELHVDKMHDKQHLVTLPYEIDHYVHISYGSVTDRIMDNLMDETRCQEV